MDQGLTIAEVAERTGLTAHTLRYYERAGLLDPPVRGANGHRRYGPRDLDRIRLLSRLRDTGMPIAEVRRYFALVRAGEQTTSERKQMMLDHRAHVVEQLTALQETLALVDHKISLYMEIEKKHRAAFAADEPTKGNVA
jgi:DNA-binding transcriptional MerR regulator